MERDVNNRQAEPLKRKDGQDAAGREGNRELPAGPWQVCVPGREINPPANICDA